MSYITLCRQPMTQTLLAWTMSVLTVAAVLGLVWLGLKQVSKPEPRYEVREIKTARLPPPPPPPQQIQQETLSLDVAVKGDTGKVNTAPTINNELAPITPPDNSVNINRRPSITIPADNWQGFSLSELDALPKLLSPVSLNVPPKLKRQLGEVVRLRLEVSINSEGQVTLLEIIESPSPELRFSIEQMVKKARFSAPQKDGKTVTAQFIWPLEIAL